VWKERPDPVRVVGMKFPLGSISVKEEAALAL
jgi:hypothetical protein